MNLLNCKLLGADFALFTLTLQLQQRHSYSLCIYRMSICAHEDFLDASTHLNTDFYEWYSL